MSLNRAFLKKFPKWRFKVGNRKAIPKPRFRPVVPNQQLRDEIDNALVWLAIGDGRTFDTYIPVITLRVQQGSHFLLFEGTLMSERPHTAASVYKLSFPDHLGFVHLPMDAMEERTFPNHTGEIRLAALLYNTDANRCRPIEFGGMVTVGQKLFLYDLRYGRPSLVVGHVTCVGPDAFILDAKHRDGWLRGALVFDGNKHLVGVVYEHFGSPIAVNVVRLRDLLLQFFPETQAGPYAFRLYIDCSRLWNFSLMFIFYLCRVWMTSTEI